MDAASGWHAILSKIPRSSSLPSRFFSESEALYVRSVSDGGKIERSRSASMNCQILTGSLMKTSFFNQHAHSSEYLKRSYKTGKRSPFVVNISSKRFFRRPISTDSLLENGGDIPYGCRSSLDESSIGNAEEVGIEIPFPCGKTIVDSFPSTRRCSEDSVVYKDLKACLTISYFHGRPFGGIWNPSFLSSEVAIKHKVPLSKEVLKQKAVKGELCCSKGAQAPAAKMPLSLRMLKRRQRKQRKTLGDTGLKVNDKLMRITEPLTKAFSSMLFIMRSLQSHTLYICQRAFCEDVQDFVNMLHREMHHSFLWLFQQVFACTPKFMLLVMVFLTDFTVFSIGNNVALASIIASTPAALISLCHKLENHQGCEVIHLIAQSEGNIQVPSMVPSDSSSSLNMWQVNPIDVDTGGAGDMVRKGLNMVGGQDSNVNSSRLCSESLTTYSGDDSVSADSHNNKHKVDMVGWQTECVPDVKKLDDIEEPHDVLSLWKGKYSDQLTSVAGQFQNSTSFDQQTMQNLVAPVSVQIEPDNYTCYDKTDLIYQYAIIADFRNSMLLSNYAQFLYLVRHDYNRAEFFFHRAMKVDPFDGEVISRFATFLWLARGDRAAAERAYKAAIAADPGNYFHAGSYAHFLWHSGEEDVSCPVRPIS